MSEATHDGPYERSIPKCPTGTLAAGPADAIHLRPAYCKRWRCPGCGWRKAYRLSERIMEAQPTRFITLTTRWDGSEDPCQKLDHMRAAWRSCWKRLKRRFGDRAVGYVLVVELTGRGAPHLHIAANIPYLHQSVLSSWWRELTGNPIVDIRKVDSTAGMAKYLAKYLTKSPAHIEHRRHWSQSKGFLPDRHCTPLEPGELEVTWRWLQTDLESYAGNLVQVGYLRHLDTLWSPAWIAAHGAPMSSEPTG